jgi:hypothetical protein
MNVWATPVTADKEYDIKAMEVFFTLIPRDNEQNRLAYCILERAQAMPKQGVVSMFEFGRGYGIWQGILSCYEIPYAIVHSRVWTKQMLMGAPGEGKDKNYSAARKLFPQWQPKLKKEWTYSDSILLAEYARRTWKGNPWTHSISSS